MVRPADRQLLLRVEGVALIGQRRGGDLVFAQLVTGQRQCGRSRQSKCAGGESSGYAACGGGFVCSAGYRTGRWQ